MVRTPPFHGGDTSSNLVGITNANGRYKNLPFFFIFQGFQRVRMFIFWKWRFGRNFRTRLCKSLCFSIFWVSLNLVRSLGQLFMKTDCLMKSSWRWRPVIFTQETRFLWLHLTARDCRLPLLCYPAVIHLSTSPHLLNLKRSIKIERGLYVRGLKMALAFSVGFSSFNLVMLKV